MISKSSSHYRIEQLATDSSAARAWNDLDLSLSHFNDSLNNTSRSTYRGSRLKYHRPCRYWAHHPRCGLIPVDASFEPKCPWRPSSHRRIQSVSSLEPDNMIATGTLSPPQRSYHRILRPSRQSLKPSMPRPYPWSLSRCWTLATLRPRPPGHGRCRRMLFILAWRHRVVIEPVTRFSKGHRIHGLLRHNVGFK